MSEHATIDNRLKGPLSGVRVIEMGQLVAGPFVGSRMADFGAEVIKVESPGRGDAMRHWGPHRYKDRSLWWPVLARNKKPISANTAYTAAPECPLLKINLSLLANSGFFGLTFNMLLYKTASISHLIFHLFLIEIRLLNYVKCR